jgi:hypothetical protein
VESSKGRENIQVTNLARPRAKEKEGKHKKVPVVLSGSDCDLVDKISDPR